EGFKQALLGALFEHSRADSLVSVSSDEDDRNLLPANLQFVLELGSGHPRHGNVEDEAFGPVDAIGRKELFGGRERSRCISELQ
ncbi:MAG: hypothetical protein WA744_00230, partial [Candidatus Acidiferrales bacterium]